MSGETADAAPGGAGPTEGAWRTATLVAVALLGLATLVALVATLGEATRQRDRALSAQAHSYDLMILARTLTGTVARSEASLGRYVISGDRALGQTYFDDWRAAAAQLDRLDKLTGDDPGQQRRVDQLRTAFTQRGDELSLIALSTTYRKNGQALARYYQARRGPSLDAINAGLDGIIRRERGQLGARTSAAMRSVARSTRAARVLSVFGAGLVLGAIVLGWLTVSAMAERASARADADAAEARAYELAAAVAAATDELRAQEARLRQGQKMEAVGQLTGGIAHDFNNMLAVVIGGLELARRNVGSPAVAARHLDSATEGANRAAALTRRLLAFSREEALSPEPIEPAALMAGMSDLLDRTLGDGVTLTVRDRAGGWRVHADRVQLENAVLNLAVNARDAMDGRGELTVATSCATLVAGEVGQCGAGDHVLLSVTDTGAGMTPEVAERVFEPFFTTKPAGQGTGLGLSQIFALTRQLGGEVALNTAPGRGTTVTLYLPRHLGGEAAEPVRLREVPSPAATDPTPLQVLVVEDDPRVLSATLGALEELGHLPVPCDDPLSAAALLEQHPGVDLVISDVLMPRRTGPEMVAELLPRFPHLSVLFVTGFAGEDTGAADVAGHRVLRKPFTLAGLERAVGDATAGRVARAHQIAAE